ncbi:hypothetical protein RF11_15502 [Thelohanellus kitauei]|uniref:Uncharacterized protein n=1 Tax=Thelohanellus kitauei TaxID=669202 RepID=A0A0C2N3W2_THEKT|nr:hypothetical protein RF11_15502 [Thelohanellus kitauei]
MKRLYDEPILSKNYIKDDCVLLKARESGQLNPRFGKPYQEMEESTHPTYEIHKVKWPPMCFELDLGQRSYYEGYNVTLGTSRRVYTNPIHLVILKTLIDCLVIDLRKKSDYLLEVCFNLKCVEESMLGILDHISNVSFFNIPSTNCDRCLIEKSPREATTLCSRGFPFEPPGPPPTLPYQPG